MAEGVAWFLAHTAGAYAKRVTLVSVPIVKDQVETLESIVNRMQNDLENDDAQVRQVSEPGSKDSNP